MTNVFLKVNKDLFKLGLNPTEVLLLAQIIEFNTTTGAFFMSDKALAEMLSVSESTVSRAVKSLESQGFIKRETKNTQGGRTRTITVDMAKIDAAANVNLNIGNSQNDCSATSKMSVRNSQNDFIKDNIKDKDNRKDKSSSNSTCVELEATKELPTVSISELLAMGARGASYTLLDDNTVRVLSTGKLLRVKQ